MKILAKRKISIVFLAVQFLLTVGAIGVLIYVDVFPLKYLAVLLAMAVFFLAYTAFSQMTEHSYIIGRVLSGIFCVLFAAIAFYGLRTYAALEDVTTKVSDLHQISYLVMKEDSAQSLADAKDYKFGKLTEIDSENTERALANAKEKCGVEVETVEYMDVDSLIEGLYAKEVQVIIFNEAFRDGATENHAMFEEDTRILDAVSIEAAAEEQEETAATDITNEPFNVYISGIDIYGKINQTSRSDVNIIASVNPQTKQIHLTSTPRDFYVPMANSGGVPDKLTHAGEFGVKNSLKTLEMLYDTKIDYYVRVNFTSLKKIINTLGGVSVYSDYTFTSDWGPSFKKGYNDVNGKQALAFCRERHHFAEGDRQRVKNHQHMFEAILNKAVSPSVLPNYLELLDVVSKNIQTNVSTDEIMDLAKMQLDDGAKWKITSYSSNGSGARKTTYTYKSRALYVMIPDEKTVEKAKKKMNKVLQAVPGAENTTAPQTTNSPGVSPSPER